MKPGRTTMDTEKTPSTDQQQESRKFWWVMIVVSLMAIGISGFSLAKRINTYYSSIDHPLFAYIQVSSSSFTFADQQVTLTEQTVDEQDVVVVQYGDQEIVLDVAVPTKVPLPTLFDRQKNWLTVVFFADRSGMTLDEFESKIESDEIRPRLGIVSRTPFGIDPVKEPRFDNIAHDENESTAEVHREQWRFDCYELLRDGSITHEIKRFPESGKSLLRRRVNAELKGESEPSRADDELQEYTWQYGAALKTMSRAPGVTQEKQALLNAGWTLPVTAGAFLMLITAFFFAIAPQRTQE